MGLRQTASGLYASVKPIHVCLALFTSVAPSASRGEWVVLPLHLMLSEIM